MYESQEQKNLFMHLEYVKRKYPEAQLLFHIPNGGRRDKKEAVNLKMQGVKAGVPDLFLPIARGNYHGLFIEMKVGKNKPNSNQKKWIDDLAKEGYAVCVCYSSTEAYDTIIKYIQCE